MLVLAQLSAYWAGAFGRTRRGRTWSPISARLSWILERGKKDKGLATDEALMKRFRLLRTGWMTGVVFPIATKATVSVTLSLSAKARIV
jgi:hypothetical protein